MVKRAKPAKRSKKKVKAKAKRAARIAPRKKSSAAPKSPIVVRLAITAPVGLVWDTLTSPRELGLITLGPVKMSSTPGAPFRWRWGVYEKAAPGKQGAKGSFQWEGTVLDSVPGSTLVLGPYPLVTITVKGEGGATLVTVTQPRGDASDVEDYEEGWADFLIKLKTMLETRHWNTETLARAIVPATPRKVLASMLDDKALRLILPGKAKTSAKVGRQFSWHLSRAAKPLTGTFLEIKKERRVVLQWDETRPASEVAIEAQPVAYGSLVSIHHTGLRRLGRKELFWQRMFWTRLLERLRCYHHFGGKIKAAD